MAYIRVYLNDLLQEQLELQGERLTIGRATDNDLVLDRAGVSAHHAVIERTGGRHRIRDLGSTNGVFVNGQRAQERDLAYWDEVQIYSHVLKYMAVVGLKDLDDPDVARDGVRDQGATMEVSVADVRDLMRLRERRKSAYLVLEGGGGADGRLPLNQINFLIGRAPDNDLRTGGWLAPARAARIQRRSDGYYLLPARRGTVMLNERRIAKPCRLQDGDRLRVRGLHLQFCHRVLESD